MDFFKIRSYSKKDEFFSKSMDILYLKGHFRFSDFLLNFLPLKNFKKIFKFTMSMRMDKIKLTNHLFRTK